MGILATILNVDDDALVRADWGRILSAAGYRVVGASSGADALAAADAEVPDLILLDVNLPDMDGFEVRKRLGSNARTARVPIIHISAHITEKEKLDALAEGVEAVLTKPIHAADLLRAISFALPLSRRRHMKGAGA